MKRFFLLFLVLLFFSCSTDDSNGPTQQKEIEIPVANFTVIGQDLNNVYQFDYDAPSDQGLLQNLTQDFNINTNYLTLREVDDLLSFYFFANGAFSLIVKDVRTGASATYTDFFANSPGRSVAWGINNETNVFFGFFGPFGTRDIGIQDVSLQNGATQDTPVDVDIDFVFQPLLFNGKIYFVYRTNMGDYKFTFYDILTQSVGPILGFGAIPISFLVAQSGNLALIKNGVDATLEIYDSDSLTLLETLPLQFNTAFSPGPVDGAVFQDGILYYAFPFVQPAEFPEGPASFDTNTQENNLIDFFGIADSIEEGLGESIGLTVQIYDPFQNVFLVGYEVLDQSARGGVLQISNEGNLISNVSTTFVPTYFVRN
ncbi:MAG: hypothetical protein AAF039_15660 [Bacteroidota bacterium]